MPTCRVCLKAVRQLRFDTGRVAICGTCVSMLNTQPAVAEDAQQRLGEMLRRGIVRRATAELDAPEEWRRMRAQRELGGLDALVAQKLPSWINQRLADATNTGRDFMLLRAYRRHLIHFDRPKGWGYPSNWEEVAARVRALDDFRCTSCRRDDRTLDVHHIVYVHHFGTHRQENLATLCRPCHEAEHGRALDFGERVGTDSPPDGEATFPDAEVLATDQYPVDERPALPAGMGLAPTVLESALHAAPPTPPGSQQRAWCIVACHHCRRSQRVSVVGDQAAIKCVFCKVVFSPGMLSRLRRADW